MEPNLNQTPPPSAPYSKDHESGREFSRLALSDVRIDGGTQSRAKIDDSVVVDYPPSGGRPQRLATAPSAPNVQ